MYPDLQLPCRRSSFGETIGIVANQEVDERHLLLCSSVPAVDVCEPQSPLP